jgi:hypothetical protein
MSGEPGNFTLRDAQRYRARQQRRSEQPSRPCTFADLRKSVHWTWLYCARCNHGAPMTLAQFIIRWGADASSDLLRNNARCTACGHKGATLSHPGWGGTHVGFLPFPVSPTIP